MLPVCSAQMAAAGTSTRGALTLGAASLFFVACLLWNASVRVRGGEREHLAPLRRAFSSHGAKASASVDADDALHASTGASERSPHVLRNHQLHHGRDEGAHHRRAHSTGHAPTRPEHEAHTLAAKRATMTPEDFCLSVSEAHVCVQEGCVWCQAWAAGMASSQREVCVSVSSLDEEELAACGYTVESSTHAVAGFHSLGRGNGEHSLYTNGIAPRARAVADSHHLDPSAPAAGPLHDTSAGHPQLARWLSNCSAPDVLFVKVEHLRCGQFCAAPELSTVLAPDGITVEPEGCMHIGYGRLQQRATLTVLGKQYSALMFTGGDPEGTRRRQ